jgi:hypothetical protein
VISELLAAKVGLGEIVRLDHRAHGAIEHGDALAEECVKGLVGGGGMFGHGLSTGNSQGLGKSTYPRIRIR